MNCQKLNEKMNSENYYLFHGALKIFDVGYNLKYLFKWYDNI